MNLTMTFFQPSGLFHVCQLGAELKELAGNPFPKMNE